MNSKASTKTARFAEVVQQAGNPRPVFLWTKPEHNPDLVSAIRHDRVMTISQDPTSKQKDFGRVGFFQEKSASYLIFPKPLERFKGLRIVGIKYDLIKEPAPIGRVVEPAKQKSQPRSVKRTKTTRASEVSETGGRNARGADLETENRVSGEPRTTISTGPTMKTKIRQPPEKTFRITIRFTSVTEVTDEIAAPSASAAREDALRKFPSPDFSRATVTKKIIRIERVRS